MNRRFFIAFIMSIYLTTSLMGCKPVKQVLPATEIPAYTSTIQKTPTLENTIAPTLTETATSSPVPPPTYTPIPTLTSTVEAVHYGPDRFPKDINPFTGLKVDDPAVLDRRPVMVKVSNFPPSGRPQFGLSMADLVFEYFIGEGMNRFSAIYYGQKPEKVGPVRSARLADLQLATMYQSVFAYASADPRVRNTLRAELDGLAITVRESTCPALCDTGAHTVNSVFANLTKFDDYLKTNKINNYRQIVTGMVFNSIPPEIEFFEGNSVRIRYNDLNESEWRYNPSQRKYLRWAESTIPENPVKLVPLDDQLTGNQLAFDNVVLLYARYNEYNPTLHNIELWANKKARKAIFFRDGRMIPGYWRSPANEMPMIFFDEKNKSLPLKPGNTWFVILGLESTIDQKEEGQWNVQFNIP